MRVTSSDQCDNCGASGHVLETRDGAGPVPHSNHNRSVNAKHGAKIRNLLGAHRRRRYECTGCKERWTTYEFSADAVQTLITMLEPEPAPQEASNV
jgi:hypothetical protein